MLWLPGELAIDPPRGRATIVIDVIRATTSIATALAAGADRVIPVPTVEKARKEAARDGEALLCGERRGRVSMDDAWCAGHLVGRLVQTVAEAELTDGARAAQALSARLGPPTATGLAGTAAGRALRAIGRSADLAACARLDDLEIVPVWRGGALVGSRGGEDA